MAAFNNRYRHDNYHAQTGQGGMLHNVQPPQRPNAVEKQMAHSFPKGQLRGLHTAPPGEGVSQSINALREKALASSAMGPPQTEPNLHGVPKNAQPRGKGHGSIQSALLSSTDISSQSRSAGPGLLGDSASSAPSTSSAEPTGSQNTALGLGAQPLGFGSSEAKPKKQSPFAAKTIK